ncbi:MAG TPA: hypothetical protein VL461_04145, partial [Dictyobacter sp.]|nr:hypothetical protein [Dictyobacter sp.]
MIDVSCTQSTDQTITTVIARGAKIYGNELMENGYLLVPLFIEEHYQDLGITPNEYTIIRQLLRNYNQANQPEQMSVNLIATALRKSPATIRYHLRSLWRKGILLIRTSFAVDGSQLPNEYDISPLLVKLEQLLQQSTAPKELPPTVSTEQPETNQQ